MKDLIASISLEVKEYIPEIPLEGSRVNSLLPYFLVCVCAAVTVSLTQTCFWIFGNVPSFFIDSKKLFIT